MSYGSPLVLKSSEKRRGGDLTPVYPPWGPLKGVRRLIIFVHGYNTGQDDAEDTWIKTSELLRRSVPAEDMKNLLLYYWPGDRRFRPWSAISYFRTVKVAVKAGRCLADYLATLRTSRSPLQAEFVGHSLGCRVVLSALGQLKTLPTVEVKRVILMAAAVPEGLCEPGMLYGPAGVTWPEKVIFSDSDHVLRKYFRPGQWAARHLVSAPDANPGAGRAAVGLHGGPPKRWNGEDDSSHLDHGDYWVNAENVEKLVPLFTRLAARQPRSRRTAMRATPENIPQERRTRRYHQPR